MTDLKKLNQDNKAAYYTPGWLVKHLVITVLFSVPVFLWSKDAAATIIITLAMFLMVVLADLVRKITRPQMSYYLLKI